jgi:hypothetical protein
MKTRNLALAAVLTLTLTGTLTGCSDGMKKTFGLEANPPDAFDVGTQAPLSLPPELGTLPAPNPGEPRPQQPDAAQAGLDVISPASAITPDSGNLSAGQQSLLDQAGPTPPGGIRAQVNQSALVASKPPGFVSSLLGTGPTPPPTVDAAAESKRLQENAALGEPVTQGSTPQESNANPSVFQRFMNLF